MLFRQSVVQELWEVQEFNMNPKESHYFLNALQAQQDLSINPLGEEFYLIEMIEGV